MPITASELYDLQQRAEEAERIASDVFEGVSRQLGNFIPPIGQTQWEAIEGHPDVKPSRDAAKALRERVEAAQALLGGVVFCVEVHSNLPKLMKKLAAINKHATKIGTQPITLKLTDERVVLNYTYAEDREDHRGYNGDFEHVYIIVNGKAPQIPGYKLLAVLDHTDAGTITKRIPVDFQTTEAGYNVNIYSEVNLDQYRDADPNCDHCGMLRGRKQTFIVYNEESGEIKQIGRQCLADYTGSADPERAAKYLENYWEFEGRLRGSRGEKPLIPMIEFLSDVCAVIRKVGYQRGETKFDAISNYWNRMEQKTHRGHPQWIEPTEADRFRAEKTIEFVRSLDTNGLNEFAANTFKALSVDYVAEGTEGFVAYSPMFADKEREFQTKREMQRKEREEKQAANADKQFIGSEGERITVTATLTKTVSIHDDYNSNYRQDATKPLYIFEDAAGNSLKWFSSNWKTIEIGNTYQVTGTVKRHEDSEEYGKSTILSRCKVVA